MNPEWKEYSGTNEQINDLNVAIRLSSSGVIIKKKDGTETGIIRANIYGYLHDATYYLICSPHPLFNMISRQSQTGQPVYWKDKESGETGIAYCSATNWDEDFYEYSFTQFDIDGNKE